MRGRVSSDWARNRLESLGFTSFLNYARHRPSSTFQDLAHEIGGPAMAPADAFRVLKNEVESRDDFHYLLVSTLARLILAIVSDASKKNERIKFSFTNACSAWAALFDVKHEKACLEVIRNLQAQGHPDGWIPCDAGDSDIVRAFDGVTFDYP